MKGYEVLEFHSLAAPRGLPPQLLKRLHTEVANAVMSKEVADKLAQQAADPSIRSPEQLRDFIRAEHDKYERIVKTVGIKPE